MASPIPKPASMRQRRNKESTRATLDDAQKRIRIPAKLPEPRIVMVEGVTTIRDWHPNAVEFWRDMRRSPMAAEYVQADLAGLYLLVDLIDLYWYGRKDLAGEIRLQRQCFGLTPIDRRRLQWEVQKVEATTKKPPPRVPTAPESDPRKLLAMPELN